jgi:hypothetical protein
MTGDPEQASQLPGMVAYCRAPEQKFDLRVRQLWPKNVGALLSRRLATDSPGAPRFQPVWRPLRRARGSQLGVRFGHKEVTELLVFVQTMTFLKALGT